MKSQTYALEPRLVVSWNKHWKNTVIYFDGQEIATIPKRKELRKGKYFTVNQTSELHIKLIRILGFQYLQILLDGKPIPGSPTDPNIVLPKAYQTLFLIGKIHLFLYGIPYIFLLICLISFGSYFDMIWAYSRPDLNSRELINNSWFMIPWIFLFLIIPFFLLGQWIKKQSKIAVFLGIAVILYNIIFTIFVASVNLQMILGARSIFLSLVLSINLSFYLYFYSLWNSGLKRVIPAFRAIDSLKNDSENQTLSFFDIESNSPIKIKSLTEENLETQEEDLSLSDFEEDSILKTDLSGFSVMNEPEQYSGDQISEDIIPELETYKPKFEVKNPVKDQPDIEIDYQILNKMKQLNPKGFAVYEQAQAELNSEKLFQAGEAYDHSYNSFWGDGIFAGQYDRHFFEQLGISAKNGGAEQAQESAKRIMAHARESLMISCQCYLQALSLNPDHYWANLKLATALTAALQINASLSYWKQALKLNESDTSRALFADSMGFDYRSIATKEVIYRLGLGGLSQNLSPNFIQKQKLARKLLRSNGYLIQKIPELSRG
ncbi:MAG: hypothetical protein AUK43_13025 [Oscillatoriales cyanobacterium CG2_30_40_61]|nr:MAG: hypothetical protein AUK43_13025 [Oscillatoriales cyanobacterium CG2_30_40_61]